MRNNADNNLFMCYGYKLMIYKSLRYGFCR